MTRALLGLLLLMGCAPAPIPTRVQPRLTAHDQPAQFVLTGRTIGMTPNRDARNGVWAVILAAGRPYRLLVTFTGPGRHYALGDSVTAWCQVAEGDTVADSVRVEPTR